MFYDQNGNSKIIFDDSDVEDCAKIISNYCESKANCVGCVFSRYTTFGGKYCVLRNDAPHKWPLHKEGS